jgi:hypothetical protein
MAVYSVTQKYLTDNYAVVVLLTNADPLEVGQSVTIAGVDATFNGTYTVRRTTAVLFYWRRRTRFFSIRLTSTNSKPSFIC